MQERISELQSADYRDIEAEILHSHRMAFTFINRLLTSHRQSDEDLKECLGATLSRTLLKNGYGENGEMLQGA